MDPLTHVALAYKFIGKRNLVLLAGIAPDAPFYLLYPPWLLKHGQLASAFRRGDWTDPPRWMATLHHVFHSIPVALAAGILIRLACQRWLRQELAAWLLHILVDIPTHTRRGWGPRFLWPLSSVVVDGVSWVDVLIKISSRLIRK